MDLGLAVHVCQLYWMFKKYYTHLIRHIIQIEKVQCYFTKCITGMRDCSYSDRLSLLWLYSLQRRRERYCIIYVWKIIEDLVPNFSKPIVCTYSERRGRYCVVNICRSGTLAYNSFRLLTCGCSAASNWKPGPHAVSTIVKCLQSPGCC